MNTNVNLWKTLPPLPSSTSLSSSTYDQIQKATEKFGPLGASWGWVPEILSEEVVVYVIVKLWYLLDGQRRETSGVGCRLWRIPSPSSTSFALRQFDESAPQKALSDAISNALSYLGFQSELLSSSDPPLSSIPPFKKQEKTEKKKAIQKLKEAYMRFPQGEAYFNLRLSELDIQNWSRELFNLLRIELESLSVPFIEKRLEKAKLQKKKRFNK